MGKNLESSQNRHLAGRRGSASPSQMPPHRPAMERCRRKYSAGGTDPEGGAIRTDPAEPTPKSGLSCRVEEWPRAGPARAKDCGLRRPRAIPDRSSEPPASRHAGREHRWAVCVFLRSFTTGARVRSTYRDLDIEERNVTVDGFTGRRRCAARRACRTSPAGSASARAAPRSWKSQGQTRTAWVPRS